MKPQDIVLIMLLIAVFAKWREKGLVAAGISLLAASIPLYYFWIFFTAQKLTQYSALYLFLAIIYSVYISIRVGEKKK